MADASSEAGAKLEVQKHISFLLRCLRLLPQPYTSADDQRMTLGYFALSALDLLHGTSKLPPEEQAELVEWVYEQQTDDGGFRGSPSSTSFAAGNVAMTYAALLILAILKDDFSRLNRTMLLRFVEALQNKDREGDGGFAAEVGRRNEGGREERVESDPRFTYCAVAICSMLGEWGGIDVDKAREYLVGCQRYDGGFGASQAHETHAGMTYCCIAALHLLPPRPLTASCQDSCSSSRAMMWPREDDSVSWLAHRQVSRSDGLGTNKADTEPAESLNAEGEETEQGLAGGFQGRPSKLPPDVCYSFWNGAALSLLSQHGLIDADADTGYVLSAQSRVGGLAKMPGDHPDLLHTYLGLASLSLHQAHEPGSRMRADAQEEAIEFGMKRLDAAYNCSLDAKAWLRNHLTK